MSAEDVQASRRALGAAAAAAVARPFLHAVHLVTFAVLLVTGLLLFVPDLRAMATGGYSLVIRQTHCWVGVAFTVLPVLVALRYGVRSMLAPPEKLTVRTLWKGFHFALTIAVGALLAVSGFVLWGKALAPRSIVEASRLAHDWLTYGAGLLLALHLLEVGGTALVERIVAAGGPVGGHSQT